MSEHETIEKSQARIVRARGACQRHGQGRGPTNGGYYYWLRSSTNLALPLTKWSIVATNPFDFQGNFSNQIPLTPGTPQQYYRLQLP